MSSDEQTVFHLCMTCGRLKSEERFAEGDCTCHDCYDDGQTHVRYVENPRGDGFVTVEEVES